MNDSLRSRDPEPALFTGLRETLAVIADYYDRCKYGCRGNQGYRKSTDLGKFTECAKDLLSRGIVDPGRTLFLDLGCADGRVNLLMSYFVRCSLGIEIDPEILAEYGPRSGALTSRLREAGLIQPPGNVELFAGSSLDDSMHGEIHRRTGVSFSDVDLFYTYITLHDLFAEKIEQEAREGALYLVYGFSRVLPSYTGLETVIRDVGGQGIAALYRKGPGPRG